MQADHCEICTDVDWIFNADPRIVPYARRLADSSHDEMLVLAVSGQIFHTNSRKIIVQ
jgi:aspartate kinase